MTDALPPGSSIGILGGGQLGRMLAISAARLGLHCHIYDPAADAPAGEVAAHLTTASYEDKAALRRFGEAVDVITFEFENVPAATLDLLEGLAPIRPNRRALAVSQDRLEEKTFLSGLGLSVAPHAPVASVEELEAAIERFGAGILKTRRLGYDGKGQVRIGPGEDADAAFVSLGGADAIFEGLVPFDCEISVIAARGLSGETVCFDPGQNSHRDGILRQTRVPAPVSAGLRQDAVLLAARILSALDYVGVLGVELFVAGQQLVVNEIAPRVHNSGHWTIEACPIDQFQQHIRAVAGWPLGDGQRHSGAIMTNLIGDEVEDWPALAKSGGLHLYGKREIRPGRKMGHHTRLMPRE
ncbi:MAG: 5-(carboxyamino)imidazole ribonucleotide synthase [Pseudomonadota bacterium]